MLCRTVPRRYDFMYCKTNRYRSLNVGILLYIEETEVLLTKRLSGP